MLSPALHIRIALCLDEEASIEASTASELNLQMPANLAASCLAACTVSVTIELRQSSMISGASSSLAEGGLQCNQTNSLPDLISLAQFL
jgi:hypothetical protein